LNINRVNTTHNQKFSAWSQGGKEYLLQEAKRMSIESSRTIYNKVASLDAISKHHFLILEQDTYGATGIGPFADSFMSKTKKVKNGFWGILDSLENFVTKENTKLEKVNKFAKKLKPITKIQNDGSYVFGWHGDTKALEEQIIRAIGIDNLQSDTAKYTEKMMRQINKKLSKHHLILNCTQSSSSKMEFEITAPYDAEKVYSTQTHGYCLFPFGEKTFKPKNVLGCLKQIQQFLMKNYN